MTIEEFKTLETQDKLKWLTEFNFRKEMYAMETHNDYTGLEFFIGEHLMHVFISGNEGLIDEAVFAFDDEQFDHIESTMEI